MGYTAGKHENNQSMMQGSNRKCKHKTTNIKNKTSKYTVRVRICDWMEELTFCRLEERRAIELPREELVADKIPLLSETVDASEEIEEPREPLRVSKRVFKASCRLEAYSIDVWTLESWVSMREPWLAMAEKVDELTADKSVLIESRRELMAIPELESDEI